MFSERSLHGGQPARRIIRFGKRITGNQAPTVPARIRGMDDGAIGRMKGARLRARGHELWLRLSANELSRELRTVPLNTTQAPAPTPDSLDLRGGMRVRCHEGYIGRLDGFVINAQEGLVTDLIVHVRSDALADVTLSSDPMFKLVGLQGRYALLSPTWAVSVSQTPASLPLMGPEHTLQMDATVEQVASAAQLTSDGALTAAIWDMWNDNPAILPYLARLRVEVRDGEATLLGTLPSPRQRASAEQVVWHIPGVLDVRNEIIVAE